MNIFAWLSERFELSRGGAAHNVRAMEGLRGFAVFLVFLVHYASLVRPWVEGRFTLLMLTEGLHAIGNVGVDMFFILSGYLIYGSLILRPQNFLRFMARRVQRIYPAFLVVFVLYVGLSFAFPQENKIPSSLGAGAFYLLQNLLFIPGLFPVEPMITVAWSLSYEVFYYLTIPLIIAVFGLRKLTPYRRTAFFLAAVPAYILYCAEYGGHVRLVMFLAGILLFEAVNHLRLKAPGTNWALLFLVLGILTPLLPVAGSEGEALKTLLIFLFFFVVCLSAFNTSTGQLARLLSFLPLRWLGNMSYSYYLIHGLALKAGFLVLGKIYPASAQGPGFFLALLVLMFMLSLVPSSLLFLLVERPYSLAPKLKPKDAPS